MSRLLALLLAAGCASGAADSGDAPRVDAGQDGAIPSLGAVDRSCEPDDHGAVCAFFCERNPDDCRGRMLVQVPIGCADRMLVGSDACEAFSFDPRVFSPSTWAYCCLRERTVLR